MSHIREQLMESERGEPLSEYPIDRFADWWQDQLDPHTQDRLIDSPDCRFWAGAMAAECSDEELEALYAQYAQYLIEKEN